MIRAYLVNLAESTLVAVTIASLRTDYRRICFETRRVKKIVLWVENDYQNY